MPRLPSLQTLRALDAAARHGSYSRAADEMGLTHGAVSHRIRALEADLGTALFRRDGNGMAATADAQRLLVTVRQALELLDTAFATARPAHAQVLVSLLPSFASRWLMPRVGAFRAANPDIDLRFDARLELARLGPGGADCAVRYGVGGWPDMRCQRLAGERLFPVCAPTYRDRLGLRQPADLARATLLHHDRQLWLPWLRAAGLDWPEPTGGAIFSDTGLLLDAAVAGEGVALARALLVAGDLAHGRLVRLFPHEVADRYAYYLVQPVAAARDPVDRFVHWLSHEIAS